MQSVQARLQSDGFLILEECLSHEECQAWCVRVSDSLDNADAQGRLQTKIADQSVTYGSRNLLAICPEVVELLFRPVIAASCREILGGDYGVVRGLYFDKPPGLSWSLPWHQDLTIAVAERRSIDSANVSIDGFSKPTLKAGICHVEAPTSLLEQMLTVRIHLDLMGPHNGPIVVRRSSHLAGKLLHSQVPAADDVTEVHCPAGSAMLMRPLLSHSSIASLPGLSLHRRTIHLELSAIENLPYGFRWHTYIPIRNGQP